MKIKFIIIGVIILLAIFLITPFIYKAMKGSYPAGFPLKETDSQIITKDEKEQSLTLEDYKKRERQPYTNPYSPKEEANWYTDKEREYAKTLLARNYSNMIKSNLEPSPPYLTKALEEDVESMKLIGINTLTIFIQYQYSNSKYELIHNKFLTEKDAFDQIINWIIKAKAYGFAVDLTFIPSNPTSTLPSGDPEPFLNYTLQALLYWAKIAEDYQVEFFTPFSEFEDDYITLTKNTNDDEKSKLDLIKVNKWEREIALPEIRRIFTGKIIYKVVAGLMPEEASAKGFDYYGLDFTTNPRLSIDDFAKLVDDNYNKMIEISKRDNVDWIVGEFWIHHSCVSGYCPIKEMSEQEVAEHYTITLKKFVEIQDTRKKGFIFDSYNFPAQKVKGTLSEQILKDYFSKF